MVWTETLRPYRVASLMKCSLVSMVAFALNNTWSISYNMKDNIEKVLKFVNVDGSAKKIHCELS